jgi:hypothetical protein
MARKPQPRPKTVRPSSSCGSYSALVSFITSLILVAALYFAKQSHFDNEPDERGDSWKVVKLPGRGKGIVATKDIPVCCGRPSFQGVILTTASKVP